MPLSLKHLHPSHRPSKTHPEFTRAQVRHLKRINPGSLAARKPQVDFPADTIWSSQTISASERRESEERREAERRVERVKRIEGMRESWEERPEWMGEVTGREKWDNMLLGLLGTFWLRSGSKRQQESGSRAFFRRITSRRTPEPADCDISARCEAFGSHLIARLHTSIPIRAAAGSTRLWCCRHTASSTKLQEACADLLNGYHGATTKFLLCEDCQSLYELRRVEGRKDSGVGFAEEGKAEGDAGGDGKEEKETLESSLVVDVWVDLGCLALAERFESAEVEVLKRATEGGRLVEVEE